MALAGVFVAPSLFAAPSCTNAGLNGIYGMRAEGAIVSFPGLNGPFARVGRFAADGKGHVTVSNTASYNGNLIVESYSGSYTVSSDCTVDITTVVGVSLGGGPNSLVPVPFEFAGSIADNGDSVKALLCGVGAPCFGQPTLSVIRLTLTRHDVDADQCSSRDLLGGYQLDLSGTIVNGAESGLFARNGRLVFDGNSAFTGTAVVDYGGATAQQETISGTYVVDSFCNVSIDYSAGTLHKWTGTLTNNGAGADIIVNEAGVVIAGTLTRQKPGQAPE